MSAKNKSKSPSKTRTNTARKGRVAPTTGSFREHLVSYYAISTNPFSPPKTRIGKLRTKLPVSKEVATGNSRPKAKASRSETSDLMAKARARRATLPADFFDWMDKMPEWPEGEPEVIGPRTKEPTK